MKILHVVSLAALLVSLLFALALLFGFWDGFLGKSSAMVFDAPLVWVALGVFGAGAVAALFFWSTARLPAGFLFVVIGAFFLGSASRTAPPESEVYTAFGLSCCLAGYLLISFTTRKCRIEFVEVPDQASRQRAIERLHEAPRPTPPKSAAGRREPPSSVKPLRSAS